MINLAPSLLAANFANLEKDIDILNQCEISYLHLDIMDGSFVPNISFGPQLVKSLRPLTEMVFDTHLMIDKPERYIDEFAKAGTDILTFHYEATNHPHRTVQEIKAKGMKAGISLNPSTPLCVLDYIIEDLDLVLIMSVNPGFGGQSFINSMKRKINDLARIKKERNLDFIIQVDGGIKTTNVREIVDMGAELIVSGSDIFGADSVKDRIEEYREILND